MPGYPITKAFCALTHNEIDAFQMLARKLAAEPADRFVSEMLSPSVGGKQGAWNGIDAVNRLNDPALCLRNLYDRYAFARRGKDRRAVAELSCSALDHAISDAGSFSSTSPDSIWGKFVDCCQEAGRKPQHDLNQGVITGLAELAKTLFSEYGMSLAQFTANSASMNGRVEPIFFSLVDLRGVGPKVASTMLRDWTYVFEVEDKVINRDAIYLQPIDRWTRIIAPWLIDEPDAATYPDWILAGKLGKAARLAGVSGIRVNMGIVWLGHLSSAWSETDERFVQLVRDLSESPAA